MDENLLVLVLNGFLIYEKKDKIIVRKEATPSNNSVIKESEYDNYDMAIEAAKEMLKSSQIKTWQVIVRYNRGLGIEYKNMPEIQASTKEEAELIANNNAILSLDLLTLISEVKVRLKK